MRRAMTLLESVAMATLLILIFLGVAFPYLTRHRGSGQWNCWSSAKRAALAVQMYVDDYDTSLPPSATWRAAMEPYGPSSHPFQCPQDLRPERKQNGSYAMNGYLWKGAALPQLDPSRTVLLLEADTRSRNPVSQGKDFAPRHAGEGILVYLEGRAAWCPSASTLRLEPVRKAVKPGTSGGKPKGVSP